MPTTNQLRITALCLLTAVIYGLIHDQFTVRMCPEYFTVFHPRFFPTESLTILGLCWGAAATLPVGLAFGVMLATIAEAPPDPPCPADRLLRPFAWLFVAMSIGAVAAGCAGYWLAVRGMIAPPEVIGGALPVAQHRWLMSVWFTHGASYAVGIGGALFITLKLWLARGRPAAVTVFPTSAGGVVRVLVVLAIGAALVYMKVYFD